MFSKDFCKYCIVHLRKGNILQHKIYKKYLIHHKSSKDLYTKSKCFHLCNNLVRIRHMNFHHYTIDKTKCSQHKCFRLFYKIQLSKSRKYFLFQNNLSKVLCMVHNNLKLYFCNKYQGNLRMFLQLHYMLSKVQRIKYILHLIRNIRHNNFDMY